MAAELEKYNSHTMSHFYTYVALAESTKSNYELLEHDVNVLVIVKNYHSQQSFSQRKTYSS